MNASLLPRPPRLVRLRHVAEDGDGAPVAPPAATRPDAPAPDRPRVLHLGCGADGPGRLHPLFVGPDWDEVRIDIDPAVEPDIVASLVDLAAIAAGSAGAVWCSHSLEHLCAHEVGPALAEFRRVLAPDGFALIRSPDMAAVLTIAAEHGLDHLVYRSPAGPVTALDMIYGHGPSIARDKPFMRHGTGFTAERLARALAEAGFAGVATGRTADYTVWAAAFMPDCDRADILRALARRGVRLAPAAARRRAA